MQPYNARTSMVTENGRTIHVGPCPPLNNTVATLTRDSRGVPIWARNEETTPKDLAHLNALAPPASEDNTVYTTDETTIALSLIHI